MVKKRQIQNVVDFEFYYNTTLAAIFWHEGDRNILATFPGKCQKKNKKPNNKQTTGKNIQKESTYIALSSA